MTGLGLIWRKWSHDVKNAFKQAYGDIADLIFVPVDETMIQALVKFWNPAYQCFTFGEIDLTPTLEEYSALVNCRNISRDRVYSKPKNHKSFKGKLAKLSGMTLTWVDNQVFSRNEKDHLKWEEIFSLASISPAGQVQRDMFALLIYGMVLFPASLDCISITVLDLFDRLGGGVDPVPVVLAETYRSLNFCKEKGSGRFKGCPQLLTIWLHSHLWKDAQLSRPLYSGCFSPLEEYLRKDDWPTGRPEELWVEVFQNLTEEDIVWKAPWLAVRSILYRCGEYNWVPLLGLWGHVAYAPLMVLRQFGST